MSIEIKQTIRDDICAFKDGSPSDNALQLFQKLGYNTDRQAALGQKNWEDFKESFLTSDTAFNEDKAQVSSWNYIDLLFQLSKEEMSNQNSLFDTGKVDNTIIESYLFFVLELKPGSYSRTVLSQITREINKIFSMPVFVLFKVDNHLTLSIINRRLHKKDQSKDVLLKVTLIKDIDISNPHRAHVEILFDLSLPELQRKFGVKNFVELHGAWQKTLDTKELNKLFYQKLANWYYWAKDTVVFPDDIEKNEELRNATAVIRLITRVIFVWFIREKSLIPDKLFDTKFLKEVLKQFDTPDISEDSTYYKAILQNLFFATLSTKKDDRKFRSKEWKNGRNVDFKNQYVYRYESMVSEVNVWKKLFADIPFLNGGLFENLDNKTNRVLVDGFSEESRNPLHVPDYLFFSDEREIDLNKTYDTRGKRYKVKGLVRILDEYKFTIAENTPIEEEVALDPELLGKVFENLLASFNPETKTTARKHTGSFYTPREIVNYMVDESLKISLSKKVSEKLPKATSDDIKTGLDILFAYTEKEHAFNPDEIKAIVESVADLTILDPACGSGAFPMGILHKLVFILSKIDPDNTVWRDIQKQKAIKDTQDAFDLGESSARQTRLKEIEEAFNLNTSDYGRKLYLIENAIYGVDIQPIAVQIAKLRFFISLIVDQNVKDDAIKPLPNLETKFVAADTLVGKKKQADQQNLFHNPELDILEKKLEQIRHNHFRAQSPQEKEHLRELDKQTRYEMVALLKNENPANKALAEQLSGWDPYDQNHHASFFDARWMYGTTDHFDIVIGNPPYVQIQNFSGKPEQKLWESQEYSTFTKTGDIYCLFYEKGNMLLKDTGVLCFITSNKWMRANYGKKLRKYFVENTNPQLLIDFGSFQVFESATVDTNILFLTPFREELFAKGTNGLQKAYKESTSTVACSITIEFTRETDIIGFVNNNAVILTNLTDDSWLITSVEEAKIKKRFEEVGTLLKNWDISINRGILTGFNEAFIINGKKKDELIAEDAKSAEILKPYIRGRDVRKWKLDFCDLWLVNTHNGVKDIGLKPVDVKKNYKAIWKWLNKFSVQLEKRQDKGDHWTNLRNCAYLMDFENPKIIYPETMRLAKGNSDDFPRFVYDEGSTFSDKTTFILTGTNLKYLVSVLNSALSRFAIPLYVTSWDTTGFMIQKALFENYPVPKIEKSHQLPFEILVDCILFAKEKNMDMKSQLFESVIDCMVFDLYFPEEMKAAKCYITDRVAEVIKPFKPDDTDEFKKEYIEELYKFFNKDKIIYHGLIHRRTVKPVEIITGANNER